MDKKRNHKAVMANLLESLQFHIPCITCKLHMTNFAITSSIVVNENLSLWVNILHNSVNSRLGKPEFSIMDNFMWCQDCVLGLPSMCSRERLEKGRHLWKGVGYLLSVQLVVPSPYSTKDILKLQADILQMCEYTFPVVECREAFRTAGKQMADLLSCMEVNESDVTDKSFPKASSCSSSSFLSATLQTHQAIQREMRGKAKSILVNLSQALNNNLDLQYPEGMTVQLLIDVAIPHGEEEMRASADASHQVGSSAEHSALQQLGDPHRSSQELNLNSDQFARIKPLLTGKCRDMASELRDGCFESVVPAEGKVKRKNMWIPIDPNMSPFYVKDSGNPLRDPKQKTKLKRGRRRQNHKLH